MPEYIGVYRLDSPLGKGGMGEVFLAWDERLERRVAIKRVRRDAFAAAHQRDRFRREARMAARLSHAAIVQIHDLVTDESGDAIVMEYVEGITLAEKVARGLLTMEALRLAREIAEGLAAAHSAGLIHRDLKAENVIVTPAGHAKILDFGLARPVDAEEEQLTQQGAIVGTSYAMSPEQAGGEELDERSDLFSFGALLYEMLTGRSPFRAKNSLNTLKRVLTEQPPPLASVRPDLPSGLTSLVDRLLAKKRDERPRSAAEVASRLERVERELLEGTPQSEETISSQPTAAFPAVPWPPPPDAAPSPEGLAPLRVRRRVLLVTALLLLTAVTILLALQKREAPLRILVLRPEFEAEDQELALIASGVHDSALTVLESLEGIKPVEPREVRGPIFSSQEAARNVHAEHTLLSKIVRKEQMVQVSLRLVKSDSAQVVDLGSFQVLPEPKDLYGLTDHLKERLMRAYPRNPPRLGTLRPFPVQEQDYVAFLEILRDIESGKPLGRPELDRLDRILVSSPSFLEACIQAAKVAIVVYKMTREDIDLERARSYVQAAKRIAPNDRRTLRESFNVTLLDRQYDEAETILQQIEEQTPGDPDNLFLRFRLLDSQDKIEEAYTALRAAVDQAPSWRNIYWLSDLERRRGRIEEARKLLKGLSSDNIWVREQLAVLELMYGEPEQAERIYRELASSNPQNAYFTNLGLALSFQKRYKEAREAYDTALALKPGDVVTLLNLADAEHSLGNTIAARTHCRSVVKELEHSAGGCEELRIQAQCFAHLGWTEEAREAIRLALQQRPDDPQLLYEASLVHSVLGDREEALRSAESALAGGIQERLFSVSAFDKAFLTDLQAISKARSASLPH